MPPDPENGGRDQGGRFRKGRSGNVAGKPRGTLNRATRLLDQMATADARRIMQAMLTKAVSGDTQAAALILGRIWPPSKGRTVSLDMPPISTPADLISAASTLIQAVASGRITTAEAADLAGLLAAFGKALELHDLDARLRALEARHG